MQDPVRAVIPIIAALISKHLHSPVNNLTIVRQTLLQFRARRLIINVAESALSPCVEHRHHRLTLLHHGLHGGMVENLQNASLNQSTYSVAQGPRRHKHSLELTETRVVHCSSETAAPPGAATEQY